jgi:hypothetical protein
MRYPTSLEEDMRVLQDGVFPFGSDRRNALVIIKGEKEVCHFWIKLAEHAIPLLSMEVACVLMIHVCAWYILASVCGMVFSTPMPGKSSPETSVEARVTLPRRSTCS